MILRAVKQLGFRRTDVDWNDAPNSACTPAMPLYAERMKMLRITAFGCLMISAGAAAQSLESWTILSADAVTTVYKDPATGSVAVVLATTPSTSIRDDDLRGNGKMLESLCPGLTSAPVSAAFGGRGNE
jgi:hypothetical protein